LQRSTLPAFQTSERDGNQLTASQVSRLPPPTPSNWIRDWVNIKTA
jgi:hypothetical protein